MRQSRLIYVLGLLLLGGFIGACELDLDEPVPDAAGASDRLEERGWLGVRADDVPFRCGVAGEYGVRVAAVLPGLAADRGGLRQGDAILALDETAVATVEELRAMLAGYPVGARASIVVCRAMGWGWAKVDHLVRLDPVRAVARTVGLRRLVPMREPAPNGQATTPH